MMVIVHLSQKYFLSLVYVAFEAAVIADAAADVRCLMLRQAASELIQL